MKKILLSVVLILFGITAQLTAQVNGTAARPLVSTAEKPVYYYIENQSATAGYTGNVLLPRATTGGRLRHALKTTLNNDSAMWQLVNESGTVKLKNKLTGYYMSGSYTYATTGDVFEVNKYEGFTYYKIRSGRESPTLAHTNNLCDRQTTETDRLHWYFVVTPESQANYEELLNELTASYYTDFGTYARSDNARKLNSLSFTAAQNTTLTINQQTVQNTSPVYFDKTTQVIEIVPGSSLSVSFNWTGYWMRNIAYVDWNNDKTFSTADATERIGYNALAESGNEMTKSITYAVPAGQALGDYRMRIMVDWFDNHSSPNEGKFNLNNGGSVVDVILRVLPAPPSVSFGTSNLIVKGDAFTITPPAGATVKYTTDDTDPATSSTAVTGTSVTATGNFKLRAISVKDGLNSTELVRNIKTIDLTLGNEYYIVFQRTGDAVNPTLALKDMGNGVAMQTQTLQYGETTQRWTVSKGTSDGLYKLTSIAGNIMYYNGSSSKFTVSASPAVDAEVDMRFITFSGTSGYTQYSGYEIQRKNSTTKGMNPIGGSAISKEIGEWNNGDGGNAINFMSTKDLAPASITWRSESENGNWWNNGDNDGDKHWWNLDISQALTRPDIVVWNDTEYTGNNIQFANNVHSAMNVNGAAFKVNSITFDIGASEQRVFIPVDNGSVNFVGLPSLIVNNSTPTHAFNLPVEISGTNLTVNTASGHIAINGVISGAGSLTKTGGHNLYISGANTYAGKTTVSEGKLVVEGNMTLASLEIAEGATLEVASGKQLTVTGAVTNNGTIVLKSDETGTATLVGNVGGTATVNQAVTAPRTYYMGLPVSVSPEITGITGISKFDILNDNWSDIATLNTTFDTKGIGYLVQVGTTGTTNISFTGTLNSGNVEVPFSKANRRFNYYGNPYPSFLETNKVITAAGSNIDPSIWFYSKGSGSYAFTTYNSTTEETLPSTAEGGVIPPMQGFWLKAKTGASATSFTFTDEMRLHKPTGSNAIFKAPKAAASSKLNLTISNGTVADETLVLFNEAAQTGFDVYDSEKMMNSAPSLNIFTVVGDQKLAMNGMPAVMYDTEIPLGVNVPAGTYTISAIRFANFAEGEKVQLIDKATNTLTDISATDYTFAVSEALNNTTRFVLVFPSKVGTSVNSTEMNISNVYVSDGRIVVNVTKPVQGNLIEVYNSVGQRIASQAITASSNRIEKQLNSGVYIVKVNAESTKVIIK